MIDLKIVAAAAAVALAVAVAPSAEAETFTMCPSGISGVGTPDTSCAFADNVSYAWYHQPGSTVFAYSPVTGLYYTLQCIPGSTTSWSEAKHCFGINSYGAPLSVWID